LQLTSAAAGVIAAGIAVLAAVALRDSGSPQQEKQEPVAEPACC
jgi:DHA2 family multidrug resistance protein-like MFS transporter